MQIIWINLKNKRNYIVNNFSTNNSNLIGNFVLKYLNIWINKQSTKIEIYS